VSIDLTGPVVSDAPGWSSQEILRNDEEFIGSAGKVRFSPFTPVRGEGGTLTDAGERRYVDFSASSGVAALGYGNPHVVEAITSELARLNIASLATASLEQAARLAGRLARIAPGDHAKKVVFAATGSEASDYACNLIRAFTGRRTIVAFEGSYHGATSGSAGVSGHPALAYARGADTALLPYAESSADEAVDGALATLESYLSINRSHTAAVFLELIQSDGGIRVASETFLRGVEAACRRHDVAFMVDEVKTGLGRTGAMLASAAMGLVPDVVVLGKALGGGLPLAAVVGPAAIMDSPILIASTLGGSNVACAAANATLDLVESEALLQNVRDRGEQFKREVLGLASPLVSEVRGRGLMAGVVLAGSSDRDLGADQAAAAVALRAYQLGLFVTCSGSGNNVIDITPPLIIDASTISEGVAILGQALSDVGAGRFDMSELANYAGWGQPAERVTNETRENEDV
jgi:4-aminobutyrate aminotransferase